MSWASDYWYDRAEIEDANAQRKPLSKAGMTFSDLRESAGGYIVVQRTQPEELVALRRWILTLFELGASISMIARETRKNRATVYYHLRECGALKPNEMRVA